MRSSRLLPLGLVTSLTFAFACDGGAPPVGLEPGDEQGDLAFFLELDGDPAQLLYAHVDGSAALVEAVRGTACEAVVSAREPGGIHFATDASTDRRLYRWLAAQMDDPAADPLDALTVVVTRGDEVACAIELSSPSLETGHLVSRAPPNALTSAEDGPVGLAWNVEVDDGGVVERGDAKLFVRKSGGDTQAALLLPAVQKVREAAVAPEGDEGYLLYDRSGVLPAPFALELDDDAIDELFPAGATSATQAAFLKLGDIKGEVLALDLGELSLAFDGSDTVATPTRTPTLVVAGIEPADELQQLLDELLVQMPATFNGADFDQALRLLDSQPAPTGDAEADLAALEEHWLSGSAVPNAHRFNAALGAALTYAANEEGAWSYAFTPLAASVFDRLATEEGRRLEGVSADTIVNARMWALASFINLPDASVPMSAAVLDAVDDFSSETHPCTAAVAAMRSLSELAVPMTGADPSQLVGIEPDEIDVAVAVTEAMSITAFDVDRRAVRFKKAAEPLIQGEGELDLAAMYAASAALSEGLRELKAVTEARVGMRQP